MARFRHVLKWFWEKLESLHLLVWLSEVLGWQKAIIAAAIAIALAVKADAENLPLSVIVAVGLVGFAASVVILHYALLALRAGRRHVPDTVRTESERAPPSASAPATGPQEVTLKGVLTVDTMTWRTRVPFKPPFARVPTVSLWRDDGKARAEPSIAEVTVDYFTVTIVSSTEAGRWAWRARGLR